MEFSQSGGTSGAWAKASEIENGTLVKLITEAVEQPSDYGTQVVAKARFKGVDEALNVRLNKPTLNGLISAFGKESKGWIGHVLTAHTEKALVSGKRVTIMYLVPQGFELSEDPGGFLTVTATTPAATATAKKLTPPSSYRASKPVVAEPEETYPEDVPTEEEPNPDDIPW